MLDNSLPIRNEMMAARQRWPILLVSMGKRDRDLWLCRLRIFRARDRPWNKQAEALALDQAHIEIDLAW